MGKILDWWTCSFCLIYAENSLGSILFERGKELNAENIRGLICYFDWFRRPACFDFNEPNFVWANVWGENTGVETVLLTKAGFDWVGIVGDDATAGVGRGSFDVQEERFELVPRPDDDEPLDEFKLILFDDVGDKLMRLLIEFERSEIVSRLSGIGRKIWASGLNGWVGTSVSDSFD